MLFFYDDRRYPLHIPFNSIVDDSILDDTEALGVYILTNMCTGILYPLSILVLLSHADIFIKLIVYVEPYIGFRYNTTIDTVWHTT